MLYKIIIADDHLMFADGLEEILLKNPQFEVIAKVANGKLLMQHLNSLSPEMILMDIQMQPQDGLQTAMAVRNKFPHIKIVFISHAYNPVIRNFIRQHNIEGYITKEAGAAELLAGIKNILNGEQMIITPVLNNKQEETTVSKEEDVFSVYKITPVQKEIIKWLAKGYSTKMIAEERGLSFHTIETHRSNIFKKLAVKNVAELIAFAAKNNII